MPEYEACLRLLEKKENRRKPAVAARKKIAKRSPAPARKPREPSAAQKRRVRRPAARKSAARKSAAQSGGGRAERAAKSE